MTISSFLKNKGFDHFCEGYSQQEYKQIEDLINLTSKPNINVMEIGFHAGHSAEIFLQNNKDLTLTSFDLGRYGYETSAKEYIDISYPNRHKLIFGDSKTTVPFFFQNNKDIKFDVIFIDGGHDYETAKCDFDNCFYLAHKDTIIIVDDTMYTKEWEQEWTLGPTKTWTENLEKNKLIEINRKDYSMGRGMSWGKYKF